MFFVREQAGTRLAPGSHVSYVEGGDTITAFATLLAFSAKEPEDQAMACLVPVAGEKDSIHNDK